MFKYKDNVERRYFIGNGTNEYKFDKRLESFYNN